MTSSPSELVQLLIHKGVLKTPELIDALRAIDRKDFVPKSLRSGSYRDQPLPIGENQTISQPYTVAFMLELLMVKAGDRVLDIGSGSGWTTALLAFIVTQKNERGSQGHVWAIERIPALYEQGKKNIEKYGLITQKKVTSLCLDGTNGLPSNAPFDKILAGAAAEKEIPGAWREQCAVGGRIVAPVGNKILCAIKKTDTTWEEHIYPGFAFVPLIRKNSAYKTLKSNYFFCASLLGFMFLAGATFFFTTEIFFSHAQRDHDTKVTIPQGYGSREIGTLLKTEGLIRSKWAFVTYVSFRGEASLLKPGIYTFAQTSTIPVIAETLVKGAGNEYTITIPEGWNISDIADYVDREQLFKKHTFLEQATSNQRNELAKQFPFLKEGPADVGLEGYLFPDTYRIFITARPKDIIIKMLANFDQKLTQGLRQEIQKQKYGLFEIVTMASLIEKEVASENDRAIVSGILWKRFNRNIPLQVDATIVYLTGKRSTKISIEDLAIDSPYNTYKYIGLPHGPIANPGLSAIRAALFPQSSSYLYYLSTPDGRTIFSRTLEEHNAAKAKYLR